MTEESKAQRILELGGGLSPNPMATTVIDWTYPVNAPAQDITDVPWYDSHGGPWDEVIPDAAYDQVIASHVLEHVAKGRDLIAVMNEAHRVLRPGGGFLLIVPLIGHNGRLIDAPHAWSDPTHVSHWWFPESLWYFCEGCSPAKEDYGISKWQTLGEQATPQEMRAHPLTGTWWTVLEGWQGVARLLKPSTTLGTERTQ